MPSIPLPESITDSEDHLDYPFLTRPRTGCLQCPCWQHSSERRNAQRLRNPTVSRKRGLVRTLPRSGQQSHRSVFRKTDDACAAGREDGESSETRTRRAGQYLRAVSLSVVVCPKQGRKRGLWLGSLLAEDLTVFVRARFALRIEGDRIMKTWHAERLQARERLLSVLASTSCRPRAAQKVAYFRGKCLSCHQTWMPSAGSPGWLAATAVLNAICHAVRRAMSNTSYSPIIPSPQACRWLGRNSASDSVSELVPYASTPATTRDRALAYAVVALRDHNTADRERVLAEAGCRSRDWQMRQHLLASTSRCPHRDAKDDARTADLSAGLADGQEAIRGSRGSRHYQMQRDFASLISCGRSTGIESAMTHAVAARKYCAREIRPNARAALEQALRFNPTSPEARALLSKSRGGGGGGGRFT